jgi:Do/DeqQ family serine protease
MNSRRLVLALLLLACGFAVGLVLTARMRSVSSADAQAPGTSNAPSQAGVPAGAAPTTTLPDFTTIADRTVPAVTNISSMQIVRRPNSPFANDPLLQFFGGADVFGGGRRGVENSLGSGVVISEDGYILTNYHVIVADARRLSALPQITVALADRRELQAEIVGFDQPTDLALLKVDASNLRTIPWGDSDQLKVAEWVMAIGNPFQLDQTVTLGIVSALKRRVGISDYEDFIQTDAAINPGNSGGALVNARGQLVGINTAIFSQSGGYQGVGFAVPSNLARRVVSELQQFGQVRRGTLGYVELAPLTTRGAAELGAAEARGAVVTRMSRDSEAYRGGLRPLDIIVAFDGQPVGDGSQLPRLIQDAQIGSTVTLTVIRQGRQQDLRMEIQSTADAR